MTLRAASSLQEASTPAPLLSLPVQVTALSTPQWETTPAKRALLDTSARMSTQPTSLTAPRENTLTQASVQIAQRECSVTQVQPVQLARPATTHQKARKCVCNALPAMTALTVILSPSAETTSSWTLTVLAQLVIQVSSVTSKLALNHSVTMGTTMMMAQEPPAQTNVPREVTAKILTRWNVMMLFSRVQVTSTKLTATLE